MGDNYCQTHDVDVDKLNGYDYCPYCRRERDRRAQQAERATRTAPRMVDDPAPPESYRN